MRSFANPKREAKPAAPEHRTEAPKTEAPRAEAPRTEAPRTEAPKTEAPKAEAARSQDGASKGEPAKKKLTAVFRPQNAQQQIKRPVPPKPQAANQGHTTPAPAAAPQPAQAAAPAACSTGRGCQTSGAGPVRRYGFRESRSTPAICNTPGRCSCRNPANCPGQPRYSQEPGRLPGKPRQ